MVELAADCISIMSEDINGKKLALMAGKGENNGNPASFVWLLAYYISRKIGVKMGCFGVETSANASVDAARGIYHSV